MLKAVVKGQEVKNEKEKDDESVRLRESQEKK